MHRLRPERRGGVRSTCSHAADERCDMAERRTGLVRWGWRKRVLIRPYLCLRRAFQLCSRITSTSRILTKGAQENANRR